MSRTALLTTASALTVMAGLPAAIAADAVRPLVIPSYLPAVSAPNGKIGAFGGSIDGLGGVGLDGSFTLPIDRQWGLQIDGIGGTAGSNTFWGAAGHFFWRDPNQGLLGAYASWVNWSNIGAQVSKVGVEGEMYNGRFTLGGGIFEQGGTFSGLAGNATLSYYAQDNFRFDGSFRFLQGIGGIGTIGGEWLANSGGLSLFGNASWGQSGYSTVIGGLKFYTGPQKSLIRRNREDDPGNGLPLDLFACPSGHQATINGDGCIGLNRPF